MQALFVIDKDIICSHGLLDLAVTYWSRWQASRCYPVCQGNVLTQSQGCNIVLQERPDIECLMHYVSPLWHTNF